MTMTAIHRRYLGRRTAWTALAALVLAAALDARAQTTAPAVPRAADPAIDAAKAAFEALPEAERRAIQDSLVWTGDYLGIVDGGFGRGTFEAIAAYQRRLRLAPNGNLDGKARADLRAAAQQARDAIGFALVDDPVSGVRIGIPGRFLVRKDANASGGSRWQSADEKVTLDTRSLPAPDGGLQAIFDRNLAIQTPGRQVTYKVIRPDFFVIAGETPTGKFYTRYAASGATLRAFSIGYDKALAKDVDRLVVAIANSFVPFPSAAAPPGPVAAAPAPGPAAPQGPSVTGRLAGTGLVLAPRQVVTAVAANGCANLRAGSARPRQVRSAQGLTILELDEDLKAPPLRIQASPIEAGAALLVIAFRPQGTGAELVATPATGAEDGGIAAPLQAGAQGAPVIDAAGAVRGLVRGGPDERRAVAGIVPPALYRIDAAAFAGLSAGPADGANARPRTTADLVAAVRESVVPVTCGP